jgi:hypothetical protein
LRMAPTHPLAKLLQLCRHIPLRQSRDRWGSNVLTPFALVAMTRGTEPKQRLAAVSARPSRLSRGEEKDHDEKVEQAHRLTGHVLL